LRASALDAVSSMSTKATLAPCSAKCSTIEAPMPEPPPDTNTARSLRLGYEAKGSMASSQGGEAKDDLAGKCRAGGEVGGADGAGMWLTGSTQK